MSNTFNYIYLLTNISNSLFEFFKNLNKTCSGILVRFIEHVFGKLSSLFFK